MKRDSCGALSDA